MAKKHWKERFSSGGICDFKLNYDFYFKWILNKTASCFYIKNLPETMDEFYIKSGLLCDGDIGVTEFNGKLYAVAGAPGGQPNEYYVPTVYTVANPILGSKIINIGEDGIVIYNTDLDKYIPGGLYGLMTQTATLLADNIISINCCQINSRVTTFFTADSEGEAVAAEAILKRMYAGSPYNVMRSDLVEKITVNPVAGANVSSNLTELVELHNYIVANYFQSIGIKSNNIRKKAHVLQEEIDVQNDYLQISILEILTSWQKGFDAVNEMYGTDIHVELNPALVNSLISNSEPESEPKLLETNSEPEPVTETNPEPDEEPVEEPVIESKPEPEETTIIEDIQEGNETVEELVDMINDKEEVTEEDDTENTEGEGMV